MSARKFRHIGFADDVEAARANGSTNPVLCGRRVRPLAREQLEPLPTCPSCLSAREAAEMALHVRVCVWGGGAA